MNPSEFAIEGVCLSDVGKVRTCNEDSVAVDAGNGIAVLADGMGGHRAGDVASRLALDTLLERLPEKIRLYRAGGRRPTPLQFCEQIVGEANLAVHRAAQRQAALRGMGTTLALALFHDDRAALVHVGDSRIYRLRDGRLELLTRDDSLLREQVDQGLIAAEEAGDSHNRHLVTGALGIAPTVRVHQRDEEVRAGDLYLLCSDGLTDLVDEDDIALILRELQANLPLAATHLVQLANDCGGFDNVSVALVRVVAPRAAAAPTGGLLGRLVGWFR
ncbi:PP2C family protein-serine/threonine phosphatase [Azospira restricta]|uniref:Serine/threonine-protein phosphatase n=1 Tax=Azospira restricta TaxID=404405 RepID=A0A974SMJ0_9RHOO|nr:protein phosphatase 2C domain-containing protein [Azospira restricta]QRJ62274.1 serine/threonine-protein phosphatase [Azospira restricta]